MESRVSSASAVPAHIDLAEASVTRYGWKALAVSVTGFSMDGFDMLILGFMLPAISSALAFTSTQAGSLVTWTMLGAVVGGLIFGTMSDHLGRIRVLTWTILIFAVFTGLCALARGYWDLVAYRTLAGIGLGGEFGIGMALAAEAWPASKRARATSYQEFFWLPSSQPYSSRSSVGEACFCLASCQPLWRSLSAVPCMNRRSLSRSTRTEGSTLLACW